jgi:glycosyltransferase involved in cell wall biosynthesis
VRSSGPPFAARRGAVFVSGWLAGTTGPNADGLRWFARSVLPHALAALPWLEVRVTGADPPPSLLCLASPALRFVGDVDLDQLHDEARVTIVPLRVGAGVKLKVVDALEAGVPVVATSIGAEGLPAAVREAIDVADEPAAFAAAMVRLLTDPGWWEERRATMLALDGAGPPPPPLAELLREVRRRPVGAGPVRR